MDFARPAFLYLIILVPLAALFLSWSVRRRRSDIIRLGTPSLIAALCASLSARQRRLKTTLWFIALIALILALARPLVGTQVQTAIQRGIQVMVVLDVSTSMLAEDTRPNRLERAKLTIKELMRHLDGNELGLVLFAGAAFVQFPLTSDYHTADSFLNSAGPWAISRPGTALAEGIRAALDGFPSGIASNRVILLLTDGEGHEGDALAAATAAAEAGVVVHSIGFGSPAGEPIPLRDETGALVGYKQNVQGETVLSRLDEAILQQIADESGGLYLRAGAGGDTVSTVTGAITALGSGELTSPFELRGVERFEWFAGLALLTLTAEFLIGERNKRYKQSRVYS